MTIAERKAREKEELREVILQGAKKVFIEQGIEKTTIRNIADRISYSVGTVYVYFKDKNAILHALHTLGFLQLGERLAVLANVSNPMERLIALGRVYIQFALENPDMYNLMFTIPAPIEFLNEMEREWFEGKAAFRMCKMAVEECIACGHFAGQQADPLAYLMWSTVHGLCALQFSGRAKAVELEDTGGVLTKAYEEFVVMLNRS